MCFQYFRRSGTAIAVTTLLVSASGWADDTESSAYTDADITAMIHAIDQNNDGFIDAEESSKWLFADLFFQTSQRDETGVVATSDMIDNLIAANNAGDDIIDQEQYQDKVLEAYADSILTADEIAYMSGEHVFPEGSTYVDDSLTVAALMQLDRDGNGELTMQELLQEDLSALVEDELTTMTIKPEPQPRTEFVTKLK